MSTATMTKPKANGVHVAPIPSVDSLVARMPEVPETPEVITEAMATAIADKLLADATAASKEATDNAVKAASQILDGTKLTVYSSVGMACFNAIKLAKAEIDLSCANRQAESTWNADYFDSWCADYSHKVRVMYPGLVRPLQEESVIAAEKARRKADQTVKVGAWIHSALTVDAIQPIIPSSDVMTLSYTVVWEYLSRMVKYSKSDLSYSVKPDWSAFIVDNLPRLISHQIEVGSFIASVKKHEDKLALDRKLKNTTGKTAAQIEAEEAVKAHKKKVNDANKLIADTKTALTTNLTAAMSGMLSDHDIQDIIATVQDEFERPIVSFDLDKAPAVDKPYAFDAMQFSLEQFTQGVRALMIQNKQPEVMAIIAQAKKLELILRSEEAPTVPMAQAG